MTLKNFICKRCGRCCSGKNGFQYGGTMNAEEYKEFAAKAPKHVVKWVYKLPHVEVYDYFISPRAGNDPSRCPWLKKENGQYSCSIYNYRPPVCRDFPFNAEQVHTASCGCKGFDHLKVHGECTIT